jgi:hypothetical protein
MNTVPHVWEDRQSGDQCFQDEGSVGTRSRASSSFPCSVKLKSQQSVCPTPRHNDLSETAAYLRLPYKFKNITEKLIQ